ncbi:hypothetical protein FKM82_009331 [Ascaphus truei]
MLLLPILKFSLHTHGLPSLQDSQSSTSQRIIGGGEQTVQVCKEMNTFTAGKYGKEIISCTTEELAKFQGAELFPCWSCWRQMKLLTAWKPGMRKRG